MAASWRQHQMLAARAAAAGDDATYRRERTASKTELLAIKIADITDMLAREDADTECERQPGTTRLTLLVTRSKPRSR